MKIGNEVSDLLEVTSGVPLGSMLGALFIVFNDLPEQLIDVFFYLNLLVL